MKRLLPLLALALFLLPAFGPQNAVRFVPVHVYIETDGAPLAAYQLEIACESKHTKIAGVTGGDPEQYREAPYYDPKALHEGGRIVLAAFTTDEKAPSGKVRVATLNMMETRGFAADYASNLVVAAGPGGKRFKAKLELVRQEED